MFTKGYVPWNKGKKHSTQTKQKISQSLIGNTRGFKKGVASWNKGMKGKDSHMFGHKNPNSKEDRVKYGIMGRLALYYSKKPTSLEKKFYKFLTESKIVFESQKLINDRFLVDTYLPDFNLIIECDGRYWHSLPKTKKKDKAENAYLKKCGYCLLRLTENEIMSNIYVERIIKNVTT